MNMFLEYKSELLKLSVLKSTKADAYQKPVCLIS